MAGSSSARWPAFDPSDSEMDALVKLSHFYGGDADFVVAGGGNTSAKAGGVLHVKASGHALANITADGFVAMDRQALDELLRREFDADPARREQAFKEAVLAARLDPGSTLRPSVECVLHNLIAGRYVVHTHPTSANALACCVAGPRLCREWFGDDVLWVPYVDPGLLLAKTVAAAWERHVHRLGRPPEAVLMQNHGLIVGGDTPSAVRERTDRLVGEIHRRIDRTPATNVFGPVGRIAPSLAADFVDAIRLALPAATGEKDGRLAVAFDDSPTVMELVSGQVGREAVALGPLCPDQIVYCGSFALWFVPPAMPQAPSLVEALAFAIGEHKRATGVAPRVILVEGVGMFTAGSTDKAAAVAAEVYRGAIRVMAWAVRLGGIQAMTPAQRQFIENWEAEAYRRQLSQGG